MVTAPASERGKLRAARIGLHILTAVLAAVTTLRALADGVNPWLVCGVAAALLACYAASGLPAVRRSSLGAMVWLAGLTVCWAAALLVSLEFVWLAFPLLLLGGHLLPFLPALGFTVVVLAAAVGIPLTQSGAVTPAAVIGPIVGGIFAFGIARGYDALLRESAERRRLIDSLLESQRETAALHEELLRLQRESGAAEERARLARDIHDTIAQDLTAIVLLTRDGAEQTPAIRERAEASLQDVRRIVDALTPGDLETGALADAISRLGERVAAETTLVVDTRAETLPRLDTHTEVTLLRAAQSSLANVVQHARASRVVVTLADAGDTIRLDIVDDGIGFDPDEEIPVGHLGLRTLRERMREAGGGLDIETSPGRGTAISLWVPFTRAFPRDVDGDERR